MTGPDRRAIERVIVRLRAEQRLLGIADDLQALLAALAGSAGRRAITTSAGEDLEEDLKKNGDLPWAHT